jgi:ubiquinone/menaquinone biosynthesis C-methylase UbiE
VNTRTDSYRGYPIIRDFWEHYTDDPALYDRFALSSLRAVEQLDRMLGFADRRVLSIASGTGKDAFEMARRSHRVVGIELSEHMLRFAEDRRTAMKVRNVRFVRAVAETLPFRDEAFDCALSIHGAPFVGWGWEALAVREAIRTVRPGGWVAFVSAPDASILSPFVTPFGFEFTSVQVELDYGSLDEALATWGRINGEAAIDDLLARRSSRVSVGLGVWHLLL